MITYLKDESLEDKIGTRKVVVDFYADWCMPCNLLGEIIEEVAETNNNVEVIKVNVDSHEELARKYGVMSIPFVLLFENGKPIKKQVGLMEKDEFLDFIK